MRVNHQAIVLSLMLAFPALVVASGIPRDLDALRTRQAQIRAGVEARSGGGYKELSEASRTELLQRQAGMLELIEGKSTANELTEEQQAQVQATVTWIDAKLKEANDERMVCERRTTLGSNRKERVCMTAAQMRAQREAAREQMDRRSVCADCSSE